MCSPPFFVIERIYYSDGGGGWKHEARVQQAIEDGLRLCLYVFKGISRSGALSETKVYVEVFRGRFSAYAPVQISNPSVKLDPNPFHLKLGHPSQPI